MLNTLNPPRLPLHGQAEGGKDTTRDHHLRHEGVFFFTDGWNLVWLDMPAKLEKEPLSIVMCGDDDTGKSTTTGCLLFELGGIPEQELDKLKQDEERLGKSSLVYIFFMARQKEEWEPGVNTTYNTNEVFTDKWHNTIIDTPGPKSIIKRLITGRRGSHPGTSR